MSSRVPLLPIQYVSNLSGLATIDIDNGVVLMDERVAMLPDIVFDFIYYHELYHLFYNTPASGRDLSLEKKCDFGAVDELLLGGASEPQIIFAMETAITDPSEKKSRISAVKQYLSKMNVA